MAVNVIIISSYLPLTLSETLGQKYKKTAYLCNCLETNYRTADAGIAWASCQ